MSPSHSRHSSPVMSEDDIISVFLRIPPDDPARLVRASVVCKAWRRILTGPDFCRLYRKFHGTPPMLGLVLSFWSSERGGRDFVSRLIPTTAFRLSAGPENLYPRNNWKAVDSRHGRLLVDLVDGYDNSVGGYIVWDPITNGRWGVPSSGIPEWVSWTGWTAAVLCAKEHCDHLGCHGPPFLVAAVVSSRRTTSASIYSSESGVWSDIITLNHADEIDSGRSILVGNSLYFPFASYSVLQYDLSEQKLSVMDVPEVESVESLVFISVEDRALVFAGLRGTRISLWSAEAGALSWVKRTVIDLEKLLPPRVFEPAEKEWCQPYVSAFAQGSVFLSTMAGLFTVELDSGRTKKVSEVEMAGNVIPWISFYTLDHARRMMPRP